MGDKNRNFYIDSSSDLNSKESKKILNHLKKLKFPNEFFTIHHSEKEFNNFKENTQKKLNELLPNLDLLVNHLEKEAHDNVMSMFEEEITTEQRYKEYLWMILSNIEKKSVFDIPVIAPSKENIANLCTTYFTPNVYFFKNIEISKNNLSSLESIYIHECIHMITRKNNKIVTDYLDDEFLNIFIEKLFIEKEEDQKISTYNKWVSLSNNINGIKENNLIAMKYYKSSVLAQYLYELYITFDQSEKNFILYIISSVLNGQLSLHKFLKIYDINLNNKDIVDCALNSMEQSRRIIR